MDINTNNGIFSNNEHLNHDVITPTVLTVTALLYFDSYT